MYNKDCATFIFLCAVAAILYDFFSTNSFLQFFFLNFCEVHENKNKAGTFHSSSLSPLNSPRYLFSVMYQTFLYAQIFFGNNGQIFYYFILIHTFMRNLLI